MTAGEGALARAQAIGVPGLVVNGNDVFAVDAAAAELTAQIRDGGGPRFLHAVTYRLKGHVSVDAAGYRSHDEVARALEQDPLELATIRFAAIGGDRDALAAIDADAQAEVAAAVAVADAAPWPPDAAAYADIQDTGAGRWRE
jgi:acetoin:2,6-dichlorophenolindophenol oxidoreductase subunit alpha